MKRNVGTWDRILRGVGAVGLAVGGVIVALAIVTCVLFGVVPAWRAVRIDAIDAIEAAIAEFRTIEGATTLFLETNSVLKPAITLYESVGFEHRGRKPDSHYARSDVYMVWRDPNTCA